MGYRTGQGIFTKIRLRDGGYPRYKRPYLIVGVGEGYIDVLNVSTSEGKENKMHRYANLPLTEHDPPFPRPSFVKLDSLVRVSLPHSEEIVLLRSGETLNEEDMRAVRNGIMNTP